MLPPSPPHDHSDHYSCDRNASSARSDLPSTYCWHDRGADNNGHGGEMMAAVVVIVMVMAMVVLVEHFGVITILL